MDIVAFTDKKVLIQGIKSGQVFKHHGDYYMKIAWSRDAVIIGPRDMSKYPNAVFAVSIDTASIYMFEVGDLVALVDGKFVEGYHG